MSDNRLGAADLKLGELAHQLNNPLLYVLANITFVRDELAQLADAIPPDRLEEMDALLAEAHRGASRIRDCVQELHDLGREPPAPEDLPTAPADGRILVVDDDALVASALERLLSPMRVVVAPGGAAALEILRDERFDLVLCDLVMPDVSGMQVFERTREASPELASRFVFVTGGAPDPDTRHFIASVPNPVLEKPIDAETVRRLVTGRISPVG